MFWSTVKAPPFKFWFLQGGTAPKSCFARTHLIMSWKVLYNYYHYYYHWCPRRCSGTCVVVCGCSVINRCSHTPVYTQSQSHTGPAGIQRHITCSRNAVGIFRGTHGSQYPVLRKATLAMNKVRCIIFQWHLQTPIKRAYQGLGPLFVAPLYKWTAQVSGMLTSKLHYIMASYCSLKHAHHVRQLLLHKHV